MKLELLTNATVVDDAVRFVASNAAPITDKDISGKLVVMNERNRNHEKQLSIATTNSIF